MPDSNSQDGMRDVGNEEPVNSPQMPPEELVTFNVDYSDHELRLFYRGNTYTFAPDKLEAALALLRTMVPPDMVSMFDPVNQQGTHEGLPVQEKRKESFPEDAALGMQQKKGKLEYEVGSSSGSAQRLCMECGISSKSTLMLSGPNGPETLCNACGLQWASESNEEAKESDGSNNVDGK